MPHLTRLYVIFGALILKSALSLSIVFFALSRAELHIERTRLAHAVYDEYLLASAKSWRMFKMLEDDILLDVPASHAERLTAIWAEIGGHFAAVRRLIGEEIDLVGGEEIEELELLSRIERSVASARAAFSRLGRWRAAGDPRYDARAAETLESGPYLAFREALAEALAGEAEEVRETEAQTARMVFFLRGLAAVAFAVGLLVAFFGMRALRRDLREPLRRLHAGATALARGEMDHRITVAGPVELRQVAAAFNAMADEVSARERELQAARGSLEQAVKRRTADAEQALARLGQADRLRRRLLSDVSHELRTPLTVVQGEAEFALRGREKTPAEYREALERSRDAAMRCTRIVEDLLFVARAEEGVARLSLAETDLVALLREQAAGAGLLEMTDGALRFETTLERAVLRVDAQRIQQVVLILLENALRYGGGDVTLRLDPTPAGYAISVSDRGPGMTESELESAFERFYRGPGAPGRFAGGAGLGLPIARSIVEAHGGAIALRSAPGEGVTATVTLTARPKLAAVS